MKYLILLLMFSPLTHAKKLVSKPIWIQCRVDYGAKGTYPSLFKVIAYNKSHVWVSSDRAILAYKKNNKQIKVPLEDCFVLEGE